MVCRCDLIARLVPPLDSIRKKPVIKSPRRNLVVGNMKRILRITTSDAALVRDALDDDSRAFEELVIRYQRRAEAVVRSFGFDLPDLEDIVQDAFLKAFRSLAQLSSPRLFGPWFLSIVRNLARRELKKKTKQNTVFLEEHPSDDRPTIETLAGRELKEAIWNKVKGLPPDIRETILLYYHDGEKVKSVAHALGISKSAVAMRLKRGRDLLRERLWHEFEDTLRDKLPSTRQWHRKGRALTLVLVAGMPTDWAASAQITTAMAAQNWLLGGLIMTGKKLSVSTVLSVLAVVTALTLVWLSLGPTEPRNDEAPVIVMRSPTAEPSVVPNPTEVSTKRKAERREESAPVGLGLSRISGAVFVHESPTPAPGAFVAIVSEGQRKQLKTAVTDGEGRYEFSDLESGWYRVTAWQGEWATRDYHTPLEVKAGKEIVGVDRVLVPGVILFGQVLDQATGEPIAQALVSHDRSLFATTDEKGMFRLEGIPAGQQHVYVRAAGFATRMMGIDPLPEQETFYTFELFPGGAIQGVVTTSSGDPAVGARVEARWWVQAAVSMGESTQSDDRGRYRLEGIRLKGGNIRIQASKGGLFETKLTVEGFGEGFGEGKNPRTLDIQLETGWDITGRATDEAGRPLEGVALYLGSSDRVVVTTSDAHGRFRIEGAPRRVITAYRKGYAPASLDPKQTGEEWEPGFEIEFVLTPAHFLAGEVVDQTGEILSRVSVVLETTEPHAGPYQNNRTKTQEDGRFRFDDLPAALEAIGVSKTGYLFQRVSPVEADREDIEVVLEEAGEIRGAVVDAVSGEPIRSFKVSGLGFTTSDGAFILDGLRVGLTQHLSISAAGYRDTEIEVEPVPMNKGGDHLRFELERGRSVVGLVVDSVTRAALSAVHVTRFRDRRFLQAHWFQRPTGRVSAMSDAEGKFRLDGYGDQPECLALELAGYARTSVEEVVALDHLQVFEMAPGATLEGTLKSEDGPTPNTLVRLQVNGLHLDTVKSDEEGFFRFEMLPAGQGWVSVRERGELSWGQNVTLYPGKVAEVELMSREPPGSIVGEIKYAGDLVPLAYVEILNTDKPRSRAGLRAKMGEFRFSAVPAGQYLVRVSRGRGNGGDWRGGLPGFSISTVSVGEGEVFLPIEFPGGEISGAVAGELSGELHIRLFRHFPDVARRRFFPTVTRGWVSVGSHTIEDPGFRFTGLEAGLYFLLATPVGEESPGGWLGPVQLHADQPTRPLTLSMGNSGRLFAEVRESESNRVLRGVTVELHVSNDAPFRLTAVTDARGQATLSAVPAGHYRIVAQAEEYRPATKPIVISGGEARESLVLDRNNP